jgi:SOS-response transcriptional repressor LexA
MTETMPRVVAVDSRPDTVPVPGTLAGPEAYASKVNGYSMSGDGIFDGDWVIIDPDQPARTGDLAAVVVTWNGKRGQMVKRIRNGGWVLESSNPDVPPMYIGPENEPMAIGRVVAVIRAVG